VSSATQVHALDLIEEGYISYNPAEVRDFLAGHPAITGVLIEARSVISRYFGQGTMVTLRVQDDPDEDRLYIVAYIRTTQSVQDAIDVLHQLKSEWWLAASEGLREEVLLSLDVVRT
jgi:hypothetical protein